MQKEMNSFYLFIYFFTQVKKKNNFIVQKNNKILCLINGLSDKVRIKEANFNIFFS